MHRKTALVTGGLAAVATAALTATAVPALAADGARTVTQHFHAVNAAPPLLLSKTSYVLTDNDVSNGRTIGRDVLYCTDPGKGTSHCRVSFAQKGGLLYANFALSDSSGVLKGHVTGGTGSTRRAKGTLTGRAVSRTDVRIALHYKK